MFKTVLNKLIECINTRNKYALCGDFAAADRCVTTYNVLSDCLSASGYETDMITEPARIRNGMVDGMTINLVAAIKIKIKGNSNDREEAKCIGFVSDNNEHMLYHFNR